MIRLWNRNVRCIDTPAGRAGDRMRRWGRKILFYIYSLLGQPHDLREEARLAGFGDNVSHFRAFLENCPRYAAGMYGQSKYHALCEQLGLPQDKS